MGTDGCELISMQKEKGNLLTKVGKYPRSARWQLEIGSQKFKGILVGMGMGCVLLCSEPEG